MEDNRFAAEKYRINDAITAQQVRLIDQDSNVVGVVSIKEALNMAFEAGMDLVEVAAQAVPPVCKIINYGKLKYELQKKKAEAKKKQKIVDVKEIKFTPTIAEHDYLVKLNSIYRFIEDGNKVKISLKFRGREMSHQEIGAKVLNRIINDLKECAKCDGTPQLEGRQMMIILSPISVK